MPRRLDGNDYELIVNQYFVHNADVETISGLLGRSPEVIQVDLSAILMIRDQKWEDLYEFFLGGTWVPKNLLAWGQEYFGNTIPDNVWNAQRNCRKNAKSNYGPKSRDNHEGGVCLAQESVGKLLLGHVEVDGILCEELSCLVEAGDGVVVVAAVAQGHSLTQEGDTVGRIHIGDLLVSGSCLCKLFFGQCLLTGLPGPFFRTSTATK